MLSALQDLHIGRLGGWERVVVSLSSLQISQRQTPNLRKSSPRRSVVWAIHRLLPLLPPHTAHNPHPQVQLCISQRTAPFPDQLTGELKKTNPATDKIPRPTGNFKQGATNAAHPHPSTPTSSPQPPGPPRGTRTTSTGGTLGAPASASNASWPPRCRARPGRSPCPCRRRGRLRAPPTPSSCRRTSSRGREPV